MYRLRVIYRECQKDGSITTVHTTVFDTMKEYHDQVKKLNDAFGTLKYLSAIRDYGTVAFGYDTEITVVL